ncbi:hypothetical protein [Halorhabdus sp. BNX81]|uniref:hypothetical protein n=1 Tax=Halorhabdus sp. BNX81 TaxID=2980181 RepID=UPI0023DCEF29|nr:hypothetical protein [Halorhabdus sp. BNX81]WEL20143.1 putative membrane protein [Halorhabdus sp. BNX81]
MQRRAGAIYAAFFILVGVSAYAFIGIAEQPTVSLAGDEYAAGANLDVGDRTYTVENVDADGDSGALSWTNESATFTVTFENDTTVSPLEVQWDGQRARWSSTLADGSTFAYENGTYRVGVNTSADPPTATLTHVENASMNESVAVGDTLAYRNNETTITAINADGIELTWAEPYLVAVENATDPSAVTFVQQFDVEGRLARDSTVYNETVTVEDVESVVSRPDNATTPLETYLPAADTASFEEGEAIHYAGNETTIERVTADGVTLAWDGVRTETVRFSEGANITLADQPYFTHFSGSSQVQILPRGDAYDTYQQQLDDQAYFTERKNGLWGVTIFSGLAAAMLLGMAYLPRKG